MRKGRLLPDLLRPPKHRGKSAACADGIQGKRRKRRRRNRRGIAAYLTLQTGFFRGSVISGQDRCAGCCPIPLPLNRPIHFLCRIPFSDVCLQTQPLAFCSGVNCAGMTQKRKDESTSCSAKSAHAKRKAVPGTATVRPAGNITQPQSAKGRYTASEKMPFANDAQGSYPLFRTVTRKCGM